MKAEDCQTLEDFIAFFKSIPDKKWCTGAYRDLTGKCCAAGHLGSGEGLPLRPGHVERGGGGVKPKRLKWKNVKGVWIARGPFGVLFEVVDMGIACQVMVGGEYYCDADGVEQGKAAAQAHFDEQVMGCLE